jgi:hypothetical protein
MWTRESEDALVKLCLSAVAGSRVPENANEADLFRLVAQLVKTRHPAAAAVLNQSNKTYFAMHSATRPRTFPEVVSAGLVQDVSRLRHLLDRQLSGIQTW